MTATNSSIQFHLNVIALVIKKHGLGQRVHETMDELGLKCWQAFEWKREFGAEASAGISKVGGARASKAKPNLAGASAAADASKAGGVAAQDDDVQSNCRGTKWMRVLPPNTFLKRKSTLLKLVTPAVCVTPRRVKRHCLSSRHRRTSTEDLLQAPGGVCMSLPR